MPEAGAAPGAASTPDSLGRLAAGLAGLRGWKRFLLAVLLGAASALAFAPFELLPLLWLGFTGLLWLLDGARRPWQAFATGWAFGFGHFALGLYWIGVAFTVDAARYGLLAPFAVIGLAAGLAIFIGLVALADRLQQKSGLARLAAFGGAWLVAEWLRSTLFGGLPWNLVGSAWAISDAMIQLAALTGVWGLSLITVLAAAAPALAAERGHEAGWRRWAPALAGLFVLLVVWSGGAIRLMGAPAVGEDVQPGIQLRLVQPAIPQALKWKPELRQEHVARQIALSREGRAAVDGGSSEAADTSSPPVTHVIWSETAVPYNLSQMPELQRWLAEAVPPGGQLIVGAPRREPGPDGRLFNSLHVLASGGRIVETYDKVRLVPFGEFVPLRSLLSFSKLTAGRVDFSPGPGRRNLDLPGLPPFSPLICYEVIYPGDMLANGPRPAWLLTITNDAWFGQSSGPYQHFATGRLRAVEEGLPLIRVANSGISAVVDSYGRAWDSLGLNEEGVIDSAIPAPLTKPPLFALAGNWVVLCFLLLMLTGWLFFERK